ncbi:MAG: UbiX family flavin prenyltransferase [candidate division NC10 bacterium]|nr:UbiX family flavin prenyltransferase [candidate division NC10 bacterium]
MEQGEYILAITGASGAILGLRTLEALMTLGCTVHLIVSEGAEETLLEETGVKVEELSALASFSHDDHALHGPLASGSYVSPSVEAMLVVPCSMKTLAGIASGYASNLVSRAADVILKEGKRLVLVVRESPLSAIHLENMLKLARLGVKVVPPVPAFYQKPGTVEELINQMVGRILDQAGLHTDLTKRWQGKETGGEIRASLSRGLRRSSGTPG